MSAADGAWTGDGQQPGDGQAAGIAGSEVTGVGDEPGDVSYEPGDVNTIAAGRRDREPGPPERASRESAKSIEVLTYLARALADDPDAVVVRTESRRGSTVLRLHVAPGDMGRVIGRRGRTAQAIRTLVGVAGARDGVQTSVDIADD